MVKISKESLKTFQSALEAVDTSWQTEFNLRETVRQSFDLIKKAKEHKVSWSKIAEILKQSSGIAEGISPESIRQYYFEFSKHPELLPKKKRPSREAKNQLKNVSSSDRDRKPASRMTVEPGGNLESNDENNSEILPELAPESAVGSKPLPKSTPELTHSQSLVEAEPELELTEQTPQSWVEPTFNRNRVRPSKKT